MDQTAVPELLYRHDCESGRICPAAYRLDANTIVIQGYPMGEVPGVEVAPNEALLRIPVAVLREAARALDR